MGQERKSLVRRMQEALASGRLDEAERRRIVHELQARVRRLQGMDERFRAISLSPHVDSLRRSVKTA